MKIRLLTIGKIKEEYFRLALEEYTKRLTPFCQVEIIELPEAKLKENPSLSEIEKGLEIEGQNILSKVKESDFLVVLDLNQLEMTSEEFAVALPKYFVRGGASISFVIGSSYGLSSAVKKRANEKVTLSRMTFTHQMARLILLEQIYRAFKINSGGKYHK